MPASVATLSNSLPSRRKAAIAATLSAICLHLLLLEYSRYLEILGSGHPLPVSIQEIDPKKMEEIQKQWRARKLLLQKEKSKAEKAAPAPKDARYFSDRNQAVPEETRARNTAPLPQTGISLPSPKEATPSLSQLGVRIPRPQQNPTEARPEADQALTDHDLKEGSTNLLNTVESVYYSYYSRLYEQIAPIWNNRIREAAASTRPIPMGEYVSQADVVFDRDGDLRIVRITRSSGIAEFDEAIDFAWRKIQRFPNPPRDLLDQNGEVHTGWTFTVTLDPNSGFHFWQPERVY